MSASVIGLVLIALLLLLAALAIKIVKQVFAEMDAGTAAR